jgi:tRNA(Arg) A34 adenosine deaminase TadA
MESDYEAQVRSQVEKLTTFTLPEIQTRVTQKRVAWLDEKFSGGVIPHPLTPRNALELLFFDYMGLDPRSLAVIAESEAEITWISRNPCPTLAACAVLDLDTRVVCRAAYEKSTQAFLSRLNPELRFLRSYQHIRPYADGCQESIVRVDLAAVLASVNSGALAAIGRRILARASDAEPHETDPASHAEVRALRRAAQALGDANLSGAILFSSHRPCPACFSLAKAANLTAIVFPSEAGSQTRPFEIVELI